MTINFPQPKKLVAVLTFFYKESYTADERLSLKHLLHYLGHYDKFIIKPPHIHASHPAFNVITFPARHFRSPITHGRLELMDKYYRAFADYKYLLVHEIDSLVLSDQLKTWCAKGYDYIGAPWIKKHMLKRYDYPDAVGNGGFSLRRVDTFRRVIASARKRPTHLIKELLASLLDFPQLTSPKAYAQKLRTVWRASAASRTAINEDRFWAFEAKKILPTFQIPPVEEALRFAFECAPEKCFELTGRSLPFGAHAWAKYNRGFWLPYLLKDTHEQNTLQT